MTQRPSNRRFQVRVLAAPYLSEAVLPALGSGVRASCPRRPNTAPDRRNRPKRPDRPTTGRHRGHVLGFASRPRRSPGLGDGARSYLGPLRLMKRHGLYRLMRALRRSSSRALSRRLRIAAAAGCGGVRPRLSQSDAISSSESPFAADHTTRTSRSSINARISSVRRSSSRAITESSGSHRLGEVNEAASSVDNRFCSRASRLCVSRSRFRAATTRYGNGRSKTSMPLATMRSCNASGSETLVSARYIAARSLSRPTSTGVSGAARSSGCPDSSGWVRPTGKILSRAWAAIRF